GHQYNVGVDLSQIQRPGHVSRACDGGAAGDGVPDQHSGASLRRPLSEPYVARCTLAARDQRKTRDLELGDRDRLRLADRLGQSLFLALVAFLMALSVASSETQAE